MTPAAKAAIASAALRVRFGCHATSAAPARLAPAASAAPSAIFVIPSGMGAGPYHYSTTTFTCYSARAHVTHRGRRRRTSGPREAASHRAKAGGKEARVAVGVPWRQGRGGGDARRCAAARDPRGARDRGRAG